MKMEMALPFHTKLIPAHSQPLVQKRDPRMMGKLSSIRQNLKNDPLILVRHHCGVW
jgi:hypothetical protein